MPRKASPVRVGHDWYLSSWMKALRVSQARLADECGWERSTMHGIYHGRTAYYRDIVNLIADKLNIQPYELLMHPDDAMALRRLRATALTIARSEGRDAPTPIDLPRTGTDD